MEPPGKLFDREPVSVRLGVVYLSEPAPFVEFQSNYLTVREREGRVLMDEQVRSLPILPSKHPLAKEWAVRADTLKRFSAYLMKNRLPGPILDLDCGNGWLAYKMHELTNEDIIGLDVNIAELEQAARVFQQDGLRFCFGDIFKDIFPPASFGLVVLNASAQYFPAIEDLVERLLYFLKDEGEIHLLDTHFYWDDKVAAEAADRTRKYYSGLGYPGMAYHYHHHQLSSLKRVDSIKADVLYKNSKFKIQTLNLLGRRISPFPWIRIKRKAL